MEPIYISNIQRKQQKRGPIFHFFALPGCQQQQSRLPSNLHDTPVFALCMGRDKCTEESHHRADAQYHWGTPRLNSSEGIKYAHKHQSQLPETWDERNRGSARAQKRETQLATSVVGLCGLNCVSFAYSVQVSGGGSQEDGEESDNTQRGWNESFTHSLSLYSCQILH